MTLLKSPHGVFVRSRHGMFATKGDEILVWNNTSFFPLRHATFLPGLTKTMVERANFSGFDTPINTFALIVMRNLTSLPHWWDQLGTYQGRIFWHPGFTNTSRSFFNQHSSLHGMIVSRTAMSGDPAFFWGSFVEHRLTAGVVGDKLPVAHTFSTPFEVVISTISGGATVFKHSRGYPMVQDTGVRRGINWIAGVTEPIKYVHDSTSAEKNTMRTFSRNIFELSLVASPTRSVP